MASRLDARRGRTTPLNFDPEPVRATSRKREQEEQEPPREKNSFVVSDRWKAIRQQASSLHANPFMAALLWVESRCTAAGMHPLHPWWLRHFEAFYLSGKRVDAGRIGLRGAKSDSCCRPAVAEALLTERTLEPGQIGKYPVISNIRSEASGRFDTICTVLDACGLTDLSGKRAEDPNGFKRSGGGNAAHVVDLFDSQGHPIQFVVATANKGGGVGYTGIGAFCDEVDLWGAEEGANPAETVFGLLLTRVTTQPLARIHMMSASYNAKSFHDKTISEGDTPLVRVARLGLEGAKADFEMRVAFARSMGLTDPKLTEPSAPDSTDIPSWVTNPVAPIEESYPLAKTLQKLLALYGGRSCENKPGGMGVSDMDALIEANRQLCASGRTVRSFDPPRSTRANPPLPFGSWTSGRGDLL